MGFLNKTGLEHLWAHIVSLLDGKVNKVSGKGLSTNDYTTVEKEKLAGIADGAQVNTVTGVKGNSESSYRTGNINITKANIGLGNVDNTADSAKSVKYATTAGSATSATQDGSGNVIASVYETKTDAIAKLDEAKEYTDTKTSNLASTSSVNTSITTHNTSTSAHSDIRELISDLTTKINNFLDVDDTTTDQLSEVLTLIDNNKGTLESLTTSKVNVSDIVDNLTTSSTSKVLSAKQGVAIKALIDTLQTELDSHTHAIADVTNLQTSLDAKVPTSRTVNGKALSTNITLTASDVDAYTKAQIDDMEFITVSDIDTICNATT